MNNKPFIDRVVQDISQRLPADFEHAKAEVERNARAVLNEAIARLDLITREEFEIQQQVLLRTRAKLEQLEQQVSELERQLEP